jgi:EAL domain-containing protein (putative c-di-GMP-specific phosphodiesterase class I)
VETLVQLAHRPGLTVTAECVETAGQAARLRRIASDTGRDWLYSRAVVSDTIDEMVTSGPAWSASA